MHCLTRTSAVMIFRVIIVVFDVMSHCIHSRMIVVPLARSGSKYGFKLRATLVFLIRVILHVEQLQHFNDSVDTEFSQRMHP